MLAPCAATTRPFLHTNGTGRARNAKYVLLLCVQRHFPSSGTPHPPHLFRSLPIALPAVVSAPFHPRAWPEPRCSLRAAPPAARAVPQGPAAAPRRSAARPGLGASASYAWRGGRAGGAHARTCACGDGARRGDWRRVQQDGPRQPGGADGHSLHRGRRCDRRDGRTGGCGGCWGEGGLGRRAGGSGGSDSPANPLRTAAAAARGPSQGRPSCRHTPRAAPPTPLRPRVWHGPRDG